MIGAAIMKAVIGKVFLIFVITFRACVGLDIIVGVDGLRSRTVAKVTVGRKNIIYQPKSSSGNL